jgi:cysteinyl-tRNA synthetase
MDQVDVDFADVVGVVGLFRNEIVVGNIAVDDATAHAAAREQEGAADRWLDWMRFLPLLILGACGTTRVDDLGYVRSWAIQLQGLERPGSVDRLGAARVDMIVIEATRTVRGLEDFPTRTVVKRLKRRKLCLAYVNVGQAEDYRTYWGPDWEAPGEKRPGSPDFILTVDPDGWEGNYPVAYWEPRWRTVLWGSPGALVDQAVADGFDGVYLDWILGYEEPAVVAAAERDGVDPARAMAELVRELRRYARRLRPGFLVVASNGAGLVDRVPEFVGWVDGISQESLSFGGRAGAEWDDPGAGDVATPATGDWSTQTLAASLSRVRARGVPVFTLDYAVSEANARAAIERSAALGFVPAVSRAPLDRLP